MKRRYVAVIKQTNATGRVILAVTGYGSNKRVACQNAGAKLAVYFNAADFGRAISVTFEVYTEEVTPVQS